MRSFETADECNRIKDGIAQDSSRELANAVAIECGAL
jgi:hypothetical protein